ncbi:hypothetical protein BBF93_18585 [Hyphomonas sp. CACIAM 19H1]|nr:hypothetical protein BBF93_18585 [Hyphomonas sp. CACIAM 19H1]
MAEFGVTKPDAKPENRQLFIDFMNWEGLEEMPYHQISAFLFAALARRYANGQSGAPSRGTLNDFEAISAYSPYADAMFLDRECANLLSEEPLKSRLPIKGRVFSMSNKDDFIKYLRELNSSACEKTKSFASELYGLDQPIS